MFSDAGIGNSKAVLRQTCSRLALSVFGLALVCTPASAATQFWDINGNTAGLGGTGIWNTTNLFWNSSATGTGGTVTAWNNAAIDSASFGGTAGTVTLGVPVTAQNLTFATTGYTLSGGTLTLSGATPTITTNASVSATISSIIAGTAGLTKAGTGTLTLDGANTYTGTTRITGGTLTVSGSLNSTAIDFAGAAAGTQLNVTSLNGLTGSTSLSINGSTTTVVLSAANNFTGATNVSSGTLRLADGGALANSALTISGDLTTLQLRSDTNTVFATAGGTISGFGNHGNRSYTIDANQLTSAGAGRILTLGNLSVQSGQSPTINFTGGNGYTVTTGNITSPGAFNLTLNASGVNVNIGAVTLTTPAVQSLALRSSSATGINTIGAINGNFSVLGQGSGTWQLTAPSSFTGVLWAGHTDTNTIQFSDVSQLGMGTGTAFIAIQKGSTLRYTGAGSQSTTARDLYWNGGAAIIDVTSASANLTFNITGGLRDNQITKAGAGQATLRKSTAINELTFNPVLITGGVLEFSQNNASAINRFAGAVTGSAGTQIKVSGTGYIGNDNLTADWSANRASLDVGSGAAFDLRGNKVTVDALTGGGTVRNSWLNSLTESGVVGYTLTVGVNGGSGTFGGVIRGSLTNTGEHAADADGPNAILNLVKIGSGTQIFSGANTYTGGTTITAGTLQLGDGGISGSILGDVTDDGALVFNRSDAYIFDGLISGSGVVNQIGSGTTILTAADSYTGGTTISAGTLQLGSGGTSGSIVGDVTNNAALVFNRSDALGLSGVISGTGTVSQVGAGTTTLTGVNSYSGGTTISAGTLTGSATSFGSGAIQDAAALVIDQPMDATFANAIDGAGTFTKLGMGQLNYTGTGSLSGATTVSAGTLAVNGSLASSAVTVQNGAGLGGNGTVGATTIQSGGTIAPGNSIGTLHINGAFTQTSGSAYQVEVDPNSNASDLIAVTGTATLQSGAGLSVTKSVPGDYRIGTAYTVLSSTGGLTGIYTLSGDTAEPTAFLGLQDSYDANNAYLTVVQVRDPAVAAATGNQQAVAAAIATLPVTDPLPTAILNLPSDDAARSAFDQLGAQAQASAKGALVSNGLYVRDMTLDRLRDVRCDGATDQTSDRVCGSELPSLWAQGFGGWGGVSGNANASGLNHSSAGMLAGFDLPILDWRLGMFGGFSNSDFRLTSGPASGGSTDYHLGAYGGTNWDNISVSLGASYTWNAIRTDRAVAFGTFTDRLQASYNAGVTQIFAEAGYGMKMEGITLEPFANLAYLNLRTDGFTEVGGAGALTSQADTIENVISTFGVRPSTNVDLGNFPVTLRGMAGWRHTFGTVTPTSTVAFSGGNTFTISGAPIARDAMALEAGFDFALADSISAGLTYGGQLSSRTTDQTARGTVRISF